VLSHYRCRRFRVPKSRVLPQSIALPSERASKKKVSLTGEVNFYIHQSRWYCLTGFRQRLSHRCSRFLDALKSTVLPQKTTIPNERLESTSYNRQATCHWQICVPKPMVHLGFGLGLSLPHILASTLRRRQSVTTLVCSSRGGVSLTDRTLTDQMLYS
jgi:hypothetical protein